MKKIYFIGAVAIMAAFTACKKSEDAQISTPQFSAGVTVTKDTLTGSVKGTLQSGKTYYFGTDVTINAGDTLVLQSGVKLLSYVSPSKLNVPKIICNGTFISLGTKDSPNWITGVLPYNNPATYKPITPMDPNSDPALKPDGKFWGGITCGTSCGMLNIKFTHLDFAGGNNGTNPIPGYKSGDDLFVTTFNNPNGICIIEDSWIYGSTTDACRVNGGKIHFMRNTIEKLAYNDGDALNVKAGTTGDMAFNLIIGTAKGGTKASNKGGRNPQTNIYMYNNTYVNCGFRSIDPDRGANINFEEGAKGKAYNNIIVNCRIGLRILENPAADTANIAYGYTLNYGDSTGLVNQFYPLTHITHPQTTDIPNPSTWLPGFGTTYVLGSVYTPSINLVGANNPQFANYPLPQSPNDFATRNFVGTYDFHIKSTSPAVGKGYTGFTPLNATSEVSNSYLKATVTSPNKDLGAYPTDGTGNQH